VLAETVVLMACRRLGAASGLVRDKAQVQDEGGEWQAKVAGDLHNWIVNRLALEREPGVGVKESHKNPAA